MLDTGRVLFWVKYTENNTYFIWNCKCLILNEWGASSFHEKDNYSLMAEISINPSNVSAGTRDKLLKKKFIHIHKVKLRANYLFITESVIYNYYKLSIALFLIIIAMVQKSSPLYYNCYDLTLNKKMFFITFRNSRRTGQT